jgi:hypothetical protein
VVYETVRLPLWIFIFILEVHHASDGWKNPFFILNDSSKYYAENGEKQTTRQPAHRSLSLIEGYLYGCYSNQVLFLQVITE